MSWCHDIILIVFLLHIGGSKFRSSKSTNELINRFSHEFCSIYVSKLYCFLIQDAQRWYRSRIASLNDLKACSSSAMNLTVSELWAPISLLWHYTCVLDTVVDQSYINFPTFRFLMFLTLVTNISVFWIHVKCDLDSRNLFITISRSPDQSCYRCSWVTKQEIDHQKQTINVFNLIIHHQT